MKSKNKLKENIRKPIESKDEEQNQNVLNEDTVPYVVEDKTEDLDEQQGFNLTEEQLKELDEADDNLTKDQLRRLNEAIEEADRGETVSEEEFKKAMARWLPRSGTTKPS